MPRLTFSSVDIFRVVRCPENYLDAATCRVTACPAGPDGALQATSQTGDATRLQQFELMAGLTGSFSEHAIFEAIHGFDSVSAVKAIQASAAQGVPIFKIDAGNASQLMPQLQLPADNIQEIQDGISVGLVAIVPQREIMINDWTGTGYIIKNPITSAGLYRISGGLAGGSTTKQVDGWQIVSLFKGAFAWLFDALDVLTRSYMATAAEASVGEVIAQTAEEQLNKKYRDVNMCSGLVRRAYAAAGICLDNFAGSGGCGDNLVQRYGIPGTNGVSFHYNLAKFLSDGGLIKNGLRTSNNPLVGDIVFFDNTTGPGAPLNHEGIVVKGPDANGMVMFVNAVTRGVLKMKINISTPSSVTYNDFLGSFCVLGTGDPACLAGNLFNSFGTIRDPRTLKK